MSPSESNLQAGWPQGRVQAVAGVSFADEVQVFTEHPGAPRERLHSGRSHTEERVCNVE